MAEKLVRLLSKADERVEGGLTATRLRAVLLEVGLSAADVDGLLPLCAGEAGRISVAAFVQHLYGPSDPASESTDGDPVQVGTSEEAGVKKEAEGQPEETCTKEETPWERLGGAELEQPLRDGLVKCVDSRYLVGLFRVEAASSACKISQLRPAFTSLEELQALGTYEDEIWEPGPTVYEWLPPQVPRTAEENDRFKSGLQMFNIFYSHPHTLVLQVTEFPAGYPGSKSYDLPVGHTPAEYQERGWCFAEACVSSLGKTPKFLCNLSRLPESAGGVVGACMNERSPPPLSPSAFNEELAKKTFTQKKTDFARVQKLYESAFRTRIGEATSLMFARVHWGAAEMAGFATVIEANHCVQHLDLSANIAGEEGMKALARVMKQHPTLKSLKLVGCDLGDAESRVLAEALKFHSGLTQLDLSDNNVGVQGAGALAEALQVTSGLTQLNLRCNEVGARGARALAEALQVNYGLMQLDLTRNGVGAQGAGALAQALLVNRSLTQLDLERNEVGAQGAGALAEALKVNHSLTHLDLHNNTVGEKGARALAEALELGPGRRVSW